ncbi:hypothetical protein [Isoptericola croceus]|uniref:hypothetical protein n=1 Tax=Isoptericola croceus TaxID=3031406 RepID=UPI0023F6F873|nr:hypothetical protein [Isoptericola croceus]
MTRLLASFLGLAAIAAGAVLVFDPLMRISYSAGWSVAAALTAVVIVWPVALGAGAVDGTVVARNRATNLVRPLPPSARRRFAATRIVTIASGGALGLLLAVGTGVIAAAVRESTPQLISLATVPAALLGVYPLVAVGWFIGVSVRSWLLPPVAVIVGYLLVVFILGQGPLMQYFGATASVPAFLLPDASQILAILGVVVGAALAGAALVALWAARTRIALAVLVAAVVVASGAWIGLDAVHGERDPYRLGDVAGWPCAEIAGTGSDVCIAPDQQRDLNLLVNELRPLDERFEEIAPDGEDWVWMPVEHPTRPTLVYDLPLGAPIDRARQAEEVVWGGLGGCAIDAALEGPDEAAFEAVDRDVILVAQWLEPTFVPDPIIVGRLGVTPGAPDREDAAAALDRLISCSA